MARSKTLLLYVMWTILQSAFAQKGVSMTCCQLALEQSAFLNKTIPKDAYVCAQKYVEGTLPAPFLTVSRPGCQEHCSGFSLTKPRDVNAWATPLVQYILPAVIFSMTIPRRLVLEPPRWFFDFSPHHLNGLIKAVFSFCIAGVIVSLDTALWVFTIMVAPAPFIFSGLSEIVLDYSVIRNLLSTHIPRGGDHPQGLDKKQRIQLLLAIVAGNLGTEGVPADPQKELEVALDCDRDPRELEVHLRALLACQYPFGAAVGAPILLYIGSFVYNLVDLHSSVGDTNAARSLSFGIWWMSIVHVAAISGCLLASNNPSTATAIVRLRRIKGNIQWRLGLAEQRMEMEDRVQSRLEAWSRLSLSYRARYEPVWMWTRGKSKASWLRKTSAWEQPWFREKIELSFQGWILLTLVAYSLVLFPCGLAFWSEYNTLPKGPGCRSLTMLLYTCAQTIFVILSAWSHFKVAHDSNYWKRHPWLDYWRRPSVGIIISVVFLFPAWLTAIFTTIAGTLMQITGIFENCTCNSTGYWSFPPGSFVSLATDTIYDRQNGGYWKRAAFAALIFLICVTYLGWWCQRFLREKFVERVKHLGPECDEIKYTTGPRS